MRRIQIQATLWTVMLAIPFTILAIFAAAYLTLNLYDIVEMIIRFVNGTTSIGKPVLIEVFTRLPELVGMAAGMLVLLALLYMFRPVKDGNERAKS